jgi:hypothetical protein
MGTAVKSSGRAKAAGERGRPAAAEDAQEPEHAEHAKHWRQDHLQPEGPLEGQHEEERGQRMEQLVLGVAGERLARGEEGIPERNPSHRLGQGREQPLGRVVERTQIALGEGIAEEERAAEQRHCGEDQQRRRDDQKPSRLGAAVHRPDCTGQPASRPEL